MSKYQHKWKKSIKGLDPNTVANELDKLSKRGPLTPKAVLDSARKKTSPLHDYFDWNDETAAEKYRIKQAGYLIRNLEVKVINKTGPTPKPISVRSHVSLGEGIGDGKDSQYHRIEKVMSDEELRDRMIRKAWNEILYVQQKYKHIVEFKEIWDAVNSVQKKTMIA